MILQRVNWDDLSKKAKKQQRNREVHTPTVSIFRWWARRSHAVFGEILDAAIAEYGSRDFLVSDPFSGGGTVAVEADRRGLRVYAQDIQPWVILGLHTTLDRADPAELKSAGTKLLDRMSPFREALYGTSCPIHGFPSEIIHTYWVRRVMCPSCDGDVYLYPHNMLTYTQRVERETCDKDAYFGCAHCGYVALGSRESATQFCPHCGALGTDSVVKGNVVSCPKCSYSDRPKAFLTGQATAWIPVLMQRHCHAGGSPVLHLDIPTDRERAQAMWPGNSYEYGALADPIPLGKETRRLIEWGFSRWSDLYPPRQLSIYLEAARQLAQIEGISPEVRQRLLLAVCGAPEMAGYVSRWDRYHLKAFEATANHRFSASTFTVEVNPLGPRGRGTLPRRVMHSVKAAVWSEQARRHEHARPASFLTASEIECNPVPPQYPLVVAGSSEFQRLGHASVRLVLTDPPYYDDVQYSELALPFNAWAHQLGLFPNNLKLDTSREAVPNASRGASHYESLLGAIFSECVRTLSPNGRVLFTFHNTKSDGWVALGRALRKARLQIIALAPVHAENETDHSKRNKKAFSKDLVLECRFQDGPAHPWITPVDPQDDEALELTAMGKALAGVATCTKDSLWQLFISSLPSGFKTRIR